MPPGNFSYQSHSAQSRTFDIGDSYMKVALLSLLDVTKVQDGGTCKKRIASTKMFCWQSWATETLCYEKKTPKKDNNFYDIEVTEDDNEIICIKIYFSWLWKWIWWVEQFWCRQWSVTICPGHLSAFKFIKLCSRRRIVRRQKANVSRQFI